MIKRIIGAIAAVATLMSLCIPAGAALPAVTEYFADMTDGTMGSYKNGLGWEIKNGELFGVTGKEGDKILRAYASASYVNSSNYRKGYTIDLPVTNTSATSYTAGEKIHLSTEMYVPSGSNYYSPSNRPDSNPTFKAKIYAGTNAASATAVPIGVKNEGLDAYYGSTHQIDGIVTFDTISGKLLLFGQLIYSTYEWDYDTWYTIDAVIEAGADPRISIYVNGAPLSIDAVKHGATFDGVSATTERVKIGTRTFESGGTTYADTTVFGVTDYYPVYASSAHPTLTTDSSVYLDNIRYKALAVGEEPTLYNPVNFSGVVDGVKVLRDEFKTVTVTTGGEVIDKVALYINGTLVGEMTQAPYVFNVPSTVVPGYTTVRTVATKGNTTFERSININLTRNYTKQVMGENFNNYTDTNYWSGTGWWELSSRATAIATGNGWFTTMTPVKDKSNKSFQNSAKIGCDPNSDVEYFDGVTPFRHLNFGYTKINGEGNGFVEGAQGVLEYKFYLDNKNLDDTNLTFKNGVKFYQWDSTEQKLKWNVTPVQYTDPKLKEWQTYRIEMDLTSSQPLFTLYIDGEKMFENLPLVGEVVKIDGLRWSITPDTTAGCYMALDDINMYHTKPRPSIDGATFYRTDIAFTDADAVSAETNAIEFTIPGNLNDTDLDKHVALCKDGTEIDTTLKLVDDKLWLVPDKPLDSASNYTLLLKSTALFEDGVPIGYDQSFPFTTAYNDCDIIGVEYYKNGTAVTDPATVTLTAGDKLKAKVTLCNSTLLDKPVKVMLFGYNNARLTAPSITPVTILAGAKGQAEFTSEITVADPASFSASVMVWDGFTTIVPTADAVFLP